MAQMDETVLTFKVIGDNAGLAYIDLGQASSIVNRKLMRQQGLWEVRGVQLYADVEDLATADRVGLPYTVSMSGAPRNWVTRNSLVKAYHAWIDQQKLALKAAGSRDIKPRWQDFKVFLNDTHRTTGNLIPVSGHMFGNTNAYLEGEWHYSRIVWEEVDGAGAVGQEEPQLCILGDDNLPQTVGLINQYSISRAYPPEADMPTALPDNIFTLNLLKLLVLKLRRLLRTLWLKIMSLHMMLMIILVALTMDMIHCCLVLLQMEAQATQPLVVKLQ